MRDDPPLLAGSVFSRMVGETAHNGGHIGLRLANVGNAIGADHAALPPIGNRHAWLVTQDATGQGLSVQDFRAGDELLPSRLGLLVIPNASVLREAEG